MTNINEKLHETITEMQNKILEIEDIASKNQQLASPHNAKRIEEIKNNTVNTIKEAIVRLEELVQHNIPFKKSMTLKTTRTYTQPYMT